MYTPSFGQRSFSMEEVDFEVEDESSSSAAVAGSSKKGEKVARYKTKGRGHSAPAMEEEDPRGGVFETLDLSGLGPQRCM